jgi:tellurite resistance protein TerA
MNISRGQRIKIADIGLSDGRFSIALEMSKGGLTIDAACFGLDAQRKLSQESYLTFFNQPSSPCGGVRMTDERFEFDLARLPASIDALVMTLAIEGTGEMNRLGGCGAKLERNGKTVATYGFDGSHFKAERAVMLIELYRKDSVWRLSAVGQGFNAGLDALVRHFGGTVAEAPVVAPPPAPKVSLSKITLTKAGEKHKVSLVKGANAPKKIIVKAVWTDNGDGEDNDDLDLRAGILLPDGRMAMITAPDRPGSLDAFPYMRHMGDVTEASASEPGVEVIEVNPRIGEFMKGPVAVVFSVYSAISNGAVSVQSLSPRMVMEYGNQVVECNFDFAAAGCYGTDENLYTYVIGLIEFSSDGITLSPSGLTSEPDSEATPWLRRRGDQVVVNVDGPQMFKGHFHSQVDPLGANRHFI